MFSLQLCWGFISASPIFTRLKPLISLNSSFIAHYLFGGILHRYAAILICSSMHLHLKTHNNVSTSSKALRLRMPRLSLPQHYLSSLFEPDFVPQAPPKLSINLLALHLLRELLSVILM
jgi:hypothetical protein